MMKKIKIGCYMVGMIQTNVYFLHREDSGDTIVVDPADYGKELNEELSRQGLTVRAILLTHGHFDHILGAEALREASGSMPARWKRTFSLTPSSILRTRSDAPAGSRQIIT